MSFDKLAGIYVYCADHHSGQFTRLYRLMCKINIYLSNHAWKAIRHGKNDPSNEWETSRIIYRQLKRRNAQ